MFGRQPAVKHMLLDSELTKYLGVDEGKLKIEVMRKLYHIIAYNLAKSRAARDGNKRDEENKPGRRTIRTRYKCTSERPYQESVPCRIYRPYSGRTGR